MPGGSSAGLGNIAFSSLIAVTLSPGIVTPTFIGEQTFTVPGIQIGDSVTVSKPTQQGYLGIVNVRVSAANTVAIAFINLTNITQTPTATEVYTFEVNRPTTPSSTALPGTFY